MGEPVVEHYELPLRPEALRNGRVFMPDRFLDCDPDQRAIGEVKMTTESRSQSLAAQSRIEQDFIIAKGYSHEKVNSLRGRLLAFHTKCEEEQKLKLECQTSSFARTHVDNETSLFGKGRRDSAHYAA